MRCICLVIIVNLLLLTARLVLSPTKHVDEECHLSRISRQLPIGEWSGSVNQLQRGPQELSECVGNFGYTLCFWLSGGNCLRCSCTEARETFFLEMRVV